MRIEIIRCEICKKEHDAQYVLPVSWVTIKQTDCEDQHLCSGICLLTYARHQMGDENRQEVES